MTKSEIKKRDREFAAEVRARGACEWEGKHNGVLCCAHIFSRRHRALRWDHRNALCLCVSHHFKAHHAPLLFAEFVKRHIGIKNYNDLLRIAKTVIYKQGKGE